MSLKAMIYKIEDSSALDLEQLDVLNNSDSKSLKGKAALVNYVKSSIKSTTKWTNVTPSTANISVVTDDYGNIVTTIGFTKKVVKPISFNAILVYDETDDGLMVCNVQIFDVININKNISEITITIRQESCNEQS